MILVRPMTCLTAGAVAAAFEQSHPEFASLTHWLNPSVLGFRRLVCAAVSQL